MPSTAMHTVRGGNVKSFAIKSQSSSMIGGRYFAQSPSYNNTIERLLDLRLQLLSQWTCASPKDGRKHRFYFLGSSIPMSFSRMQIGPRRLLNFRLAEQVRRMVGDQHLTASVHVKLASKSSNAEFALEDRFAAVRPKQTMYSGRMISSCRSRNGRQFSISSCSGVRLPGGRHLIVLRMKTSLGKVQASIILVRSWPVARQTAGPKRPHRHPVLRLRSRLVAEWLPSPEPR